jgi:hypothetical protein
MSRPVWLDTTGAQARTLGPGRGISASHIRSLRVRVRAAREEVSSAAEAGVLPHERARQQAPALTAAVHDALPTGAFVVVGEPGALRALRVFGTRAAEVRWSEAPLHADPGVPTVEVPGPDWARSGPEATVALAAEQVQALCGVEHFADMDGRFGVFSPLSRALLLRSGMELDPVDTMLAELSAACRQPSSDPVAGLASWLLANALDDNTPELAIMGAGPGARELAAWAAGALSAIALGVPEGQLARSVGVRARHVLPGDESALGWLTAPGSMPWLLTIEPGVHGAHDPLLATHRAHQHSVGGPVLRLRMRNDRPASLAAAAWMVIEAALTVAVVIGVPPLTMPEADAFHRLRSEAQSDSRLGD